MKKRADKAGFAMLEVMMIMTLFLVISASLLSLSSGLVRQAVRQKEKQEAYCAASAAVRMMEKELLKEGEVSEAAAALEDGIDRTEGSIKICTEESTVQSPVWIMSEKMDDGRLILKAEAMAGEQTETAFLILDMAERTEYSAELWEKSGEE